MVLIDMVNFFHRKARLEVASICVVGLHATITSRPCFGDHAFGSALTIIRASLLSLLHSSFIADPWDRRCSVVPRSSPH